ncbi:potassium transporter Kup [Allobranchiibius sp. GilTou73]|uniref:potassium transporter Kup n=1 Tax=Allobranchiibius sp. GilTou73 TaxID=2904523 RepID=UPI001F2E21D9|nr:potassium transporter Kup [Allobranchiibius sp. GilTou73]UIJ34939.1 potassium transporter Kup [Allobranchiibius sp. GilTou73]
MTTEQALPKGAPADRPTSPVTHGSSGPALALAALGVVFGDIGTSPLYALQTVFSIDHSKVTADRGDVYGVISLVFWSITVVVSIKYVLFILRADNDGEGGVMALAALVRRHVPTGGKRFGVVMILGVLGASLFYGDSVITPAVSVLSAVEGLEVPAPSLAHVVVPVGAVIITVLFLAQRFGTHVVGRLFGPVMVVWFVVLGVLGLRKVIGDPAILKGLSPSYAVLFVVDHQYIAFVAMGAVVLSITGAEALYADMGHFGPSPIRRAWFFLVFPCLTLNYLGQGALIVHDPSSVKNPFFLLAPNWAQLPLVVLATAATVIASQAVISGAFSVSRQAERLGYLPQLTVRYTSASSSGQIYVPSINWILYAGVMILLLVFQSSAKLATAYGLAVTGTFLITTTLFLAYAESAWKWARWKLLLVGILFGLLELTYFGANLTKIVHGGWLPLLIALLVCTAMLTWRKGSRIVTERRAKLEGPIEPFVQWLDAAPLTTVPGTAIFLHPGRPTTPLALRENANFNHVIHENVFIVSTSPENIPHVADADRFEAQPLGGSYDAITHVTLRFGFQDEQDVPEGLRFAATQGLAIDPDQAYYYLSRITVHPSSRPGMSRWRKRVFLGMAHNAASPVDYFKLPPDRTVAMGAQVFF